MKVRVLGQETNISPCPAVFGAECCRATDNTGVWCHHGPEQGVLSEFLGEHERHLLGFQGEKWEIRISVQVSQENTGNGEGLVVSAPGD